MAHLKFKRIHITVKTLRVSKDLDIKHHEFELPELKQVVTHSLYKKDQLEDSLCLSYKKTIGDEIQKIVIETNRVVSFTTMN